MADKQKIAEERARNFNRLTEELSDEGYTAENAVVSVLMANVLTVLTAMPLIVVFGLVFRALHESFLLPNFGIFPAVFLSIPVHELLHGLGWYPACKKGWKKSIHFGVIWEAITPYCHCSEVLSVGQYYAGLLTPCMVLGVIPSIISLVAGSGFWFWFGIINILLAGGDLTIACVIARYIGKDVKLLDHPSEVGCVAFVKI